MQKLLVANRGEIAVRVLRAAAELDVRTVAMYSHEDRASLHRLKADEAYAVGDAGHPVRAYLDAGAIVDLAVRVGADAVHPGYGFLSESPELASACAAAGVCFVGPGAEVLRLTGDKTRAREAAARAGVPVLRASPPVTDGDQALDEAERLGYPVFVKAAAGGGGRGLRLVDSARNLPEAVATARREAQGAFGDGTVYLEEAVVRPRHIEVQVIADDTGSVMHVLERDCSVQRRHQKVVEICPAPNLDPGLRQQLLDDAVTFARAVGYVNAGTVEFLVGADGRHAFIEMNPRIQVEHTVTEEVTGVDLVQAQLRVARGEALGEIGLDPTTLQSRGTAIQCRVTTEDPANGFRPDLGRVTAVREVGGAGIRVDSASVEAGMEVTPYFDPLLVKLTARGPDLAAAARRARRAVSEFRVRGVQTNQAFLAALLADEDFLAGGVTTGFIDEHPELTRADLSNDRTSRLLAFLADRTVNRPHGERRSLVDPAEKLPSSPSGPPPAGSRQRLLELGPERFAAELRAQAAVGVTDTTFRDAHQSLLATRLRTYDMLAVAPIVARRLAGLLSLEMWGGATFDAALRFLHEDPWDRLRALRQATPNVCFQMLLRGQNVLGYGTYPTRVVEAFVAEAADAGMDVFRVFDALNDVDRVAPAIRAVRAAGRLAEGTICYTGDLLDPDQRVYTLDRYLRVAEELVDAGAHLLCIKDMAGLLRAPAAHLLVSRLRDRFDVPVHLHTHDTSGGQLATYLAAIDAGVDAVDGAMAPLSGGSSQPNLAALVAATDHTDRATGLDLDDLDALEPYWNAVRAVYAPFDIGLPSPTGRVYRHEIPGGQLSNLRQQARALGLGDQFDVVEDTYARCAALLGDPVKVTPVSKVVGDLALYVVSSGIDVEALADHPEDHDLPASVVGYLAGDLGVPAGGWPEPFRSRALERHVGASDGTDEPDPVLDLPPGGARRQQLSHVLFPGPSAEFADVSTRYGDVSVLPTPEFFHGLQDGRETPVDLAPGVRLYMELEAVTEADERGRRTVMMRVNGQTRFVEAVDRALGSEAPRVERADPDDDGHVAAPLTGVVTIDVVVGAQVEPGDRLATIEAMKMESVVSARRAGTVTRVAAATGSNVEPGDLLVVLE